MNGPRICCVVCGTPTDTLFSQRCALCSGDIEGPCAAPTKGSDQHIGQMISARAVISNVTVPDNENVGACIAAELARLDGYDPEDKHGGLYDMQWDEGSPPEPLGDEWSMNYLQKGERIAEVLKFDCLKVVQDASREDGRELRRLCEHRDQLKRELAEVKQQRDDLIVDLAHASSARDVLSKTCSALAEGCAFPTDEVMKAVRDRCRDALALAGDT